MRFSFSKHVISKSWVRNSELKIKYWLKLDENKMRIKEWMKEDEWMNERLNETIPDLVIQEIPENKIKKQQSIFQQLLYHKRILINFYQDACVEKCKIIESEKMGNSILYPIYFFILKSSHVFASQFGSERAWHIEYKCTYNHYFIQHYTWKWYPTLSRVVTNCSLQ